MVDIIERGAIISGIGLSRIGRKTGIAGLDLTVESAMQAIADAGLRPSDIDGVCTLGETPVADVCASLGIEPGLIGGALGRFGLQSPVVEAFEAVATRRARHVLVYRTVNMFGGSVLPAPSGSGSASASGSGSGSGSASASAGTATHGPSGPRSEPGRPNPMADIERMIVMHAYAAPNWLAMHTRRHMHQYGTTREQLGWLAVNSRRNAGLNDRAAYRDPITLDDYFAARMVSDPLCLLDCDVPVDGSIAFVISASEYSGHCDHPVRVEAAGGADSWGGWDQRPDYPNMLAVDAARELWTRTDLTPADVDVAELYDGFTFLTFAWLEALGFCDEGGAGPFVEGATRIALDGALPLNTYGGQLSAGRMHGYWVVHEACLQLRGQAGTRQVPGAEVAAVSNGGGPIAGCLLLTR